MRDALLIAKREYLEQIRGRTFKVTTVLIPTVFALLFGVSLFANKGSGIARHLAIASSDVQLANRLRDHLLTDRSAKTGIDIIAPATSSDYEDLRTRVKAKQLDGFLWLEGQPGEIPRAIYESRSSANFMRGRSTATISRLTSALNQALIQQRLSERGMSPAEVASLTGRISIETKSTQNGQATDSNSNNSTVGFPATAYIMSFLLSFTCVMYGMNVGRSVIQEKTSRVFEVMLASVKAQDLLTGKLLGIGAVGLTQLGIWIAAAFFLSSSSLAASIMNDEIKLHVSILELVLFCIYFLLGYLLYSSLFAGLASTVESEQEFQQYAPLAAVPIWLSFSLFPMLVNDPNAGWSIAISMFPPCAPITMFLRIASQFPPMWQIVTSILLMVLSILLVLWFSSRIYRIGILMYGKRATLPEILRWLRYS